MIEYFLTPLGLSHPPPEKGSSKSANRNIKSKDFNQQERDDDVSVNSKYPGILTILMIKWQRIFGNTYQYNLLIFDDTYRHNSRIFTDTSCSYCIEEIVSRKFYSLFCLLLTIQYVLNSEQKVPLISIFYSLFSILLKSEQKVLFPILSSTHFLVHTKQ